MDEPSAPPARAPEPSAPLDRARIDALCTEYAAEQEGWEDVATSVLRVLRRALSRAGVRALLSSRAKEPDAFRQKLLHKGRVPTDLAACRVLVYRGSDAEAAERVVRAALPLASVPDAVERHDKPSGYRATHLLVVAPRPAFELRVFSDPICEVQIVSLASHVYNELEHEIRYKPSVTVPSGCFLTPEEARALEQLRRASRALDAAAEELITAHERARVTR